MLVLLGHSWRMICFPGNPVLLEVIRSGETPGQRRRLLQHMMGEALMSQHFWDNRKPEHSQDVGRDLFEQQVHVSQHLPGIFTKAVPSELLWAQPQLLNNLKMLILGLEHIGLPQIQVRQAARKTWAQSAGWTLAKGCWIHRDGERHVGETEDLISDFCSVDSVCNTSPSGEPSSPHLDLHWAGHWCLNQPLLALDIYCRCSWGDHPECPFSHWIEAGSCRVWVIVAISEVCGGVRWTTFSADTKKLFVTRLEYLLGHTPVGLFHISPDLLQLHPTSSGEIQKQACEYLDTASAISSHHREKGEYPTDGLGMVPLLLKHCYWEEVWPWVREQERGQEPWHFRLGYFLCLKKWNFSQQLRLFGWGIFI